ncbi:hypothetical protein LNKW23_05610 [Paralimibaculum aggregatum]|uniref:EamA domain-containing protein n=1 Tax=Paralimibaculum aggregatum TaxID=3036245 RepID=A0ABQ6LDA7_9RHOB|nr:DMT family transporter [Limibaculum sp. NKW23]GMG81348.1 hypothetical protein LNKW23_05610 [Limibaculum sp. NKW23]
MNNGKELRAKIATLFGGAVWGAFWVPVRWLEAAGIAGIWPVALLYGVGALALLPLAAWRWRQLRAGGWRLHLAGLMLGSAMAVYATAFLFTEVVPAVLLYYLSPVWGFLLAWLVLGDRMTPPRWAALVLALAGAALALGPESWPPMPRNIGDWMALSSGMLWVLGSMLMLARPVAGSLDYGISFFLWGAFVMCLAAVIVGPLPEAGAVTGALPWLVPLVIVLVLPGCMAAIHGASVLNPGLVGILFMAEIGVSLVLAWHLTDEHIGMPQLAGVALIALAGAAEGLWSIGRGRVLRRRARQLE